MKYMLLNIKYQASREVLESAVSYAIHCGYRHFDCAWIYGNEDIIGKVLKEETEDHGLNREDFFISSKIWYTYNTKNKIEICLNDTLNELQTDYLDLYVLQWPMTFKVALYSSRDFVVNVSYIVCFRMTLQRSPHILILHLQPKQITQQSIRFLNSCSKKVKSKTLV